MGFVNSLTADKVEAVFQNLSQTFVNGELGDPVWSTIATVDVVFYVGSSADSIVQERYRVDLAGVILADPEDLTIAIPDDARVLIGGKYYSVIYADDVAGQGKVIQIPVKRFA